MTARAPSDGGVAARRPSQSRPATSPLRRTRSAADTRDPTPLLARPQLTPVMVRTAATRAEYDSHADPHLVEYFRRETVQQALRTQGMPPPAVALAMAGPDGDAEWNPPRTPGTPYTPQTPARRAASAPTDVIYRGRGSGTVASSPHPTPPLPAHGFTRAASAAASALKPSPERRVTSLLDRCGGGGGGDV
jgi:hypothetical protein